MLYLKAIYCGETRNRGFITIKEIIKRALSYQRIKPENYVYEKEIQQIMSLKS